jgi:uncharacterized protein YndB with AHSA1/START domain
MYGTTEQLDNGQSRLRFTRTFAHPIDKVWRAVTEPEHLAAWFPTTIDGRREAGAPLVFAFPKGQAPPFDGEVIAFEPQSLFEFRWGTDVIRMELRPSRDGTLFTLLDTLEERGKAARDAAGWHTCLDALAAALDGDPTARHALESWEDVHRHYVASFGPEGATIRPPGGS